MAARIRNIHLLAIEAAIEAGKEILKFYDQDKILVEYKGDNSPITLADIAANRIIIEILLKTDYPIISEENKQIEYKTRKEGSFFWIVDPLDGTKEFIKKNGEFTVNIALCYEGTPIFGVIYGPVKRALYYGFVEDLKAYKNILNNEHAMNRGFGMNSDRIYPARNNKDKIRVVSSRSHMNDETINFIDELKNEYSEIEIVPKGSSLKFCLLAEGKADIYPRFAPTMEWDTAAGHALCAAVGLKVISQETGEELIYNKKNLLNPFFLVRV